MITNNSLPGIHHVTAITADPQKNIDFYCNVLGLRLVKLTVNFDDPQSYHLYYGDEAGHPGTLLTFFAWPGALRGVSGPPQVTTTAFAAPGDSLAFWQDRLRENGVAIQLSVARFEDQFLSFMDPDGLPLEIVATKTESISVSHISSMRAVPLERSLRGFQGVTICEDGYENTATFLTEVMGFRAEGSDGNRFRYRSGDGIASTIDVVCAPGAPRGQIGAGAVHHVAYRTPDDIEQKAWRKELVRAKLNVTPIIDRNYFHSIYFREPGGVLFEIATENPGFTADESFEELGSKLMLPAHLEPHRFVLERILPSLRLPSGKVIGESRAAT